MVILNLLECEVQLFVSLCSHFRCQSSATFGLHIANPFQAVRSILFFVLANNMHFYGGFSVFRWTPLSNNVFNDLSLNNEKHGLED